MSTYYTFFRKKPDDLELEGVNIIIKTMKKKFPFVVGWYFNDNNPLKYETLVVIDLIIDSNKLCEFFNTELYESLTEVKTPTYGFCHVLRHNFDECFEYSKKISRFVETIYRLLPKKYKFKLYVKNEKTGIVELHDGDISLDISKYKIT